MTHTEGGKTLVFDRPESYSIRVLVGTLSVKVGAVPLTLSVSSGVLIGGLELGWLRSVHPTSAEYRSRQCGS